MVKVKCNGRMDEDVGCGYIWTFTARKPSWKLKRSYYVRCPRCGVKVFERVKRRVLGGQANPVP